MNTHPQSEPDLERGASAVEYALLVAFIAAVIVTTVATLGVKVFALYDITF